MNKYLKLGNRCYLFRFRVGFFIVCLLLLILLCQLGVWQIHRYHFKQNLELDYQKNLALPFQPLTTIENNKNLDFKKVSIQGNYVFNIFVQNKIHHNKMGFQIFSALQVKNQNKILLVDRGWIEKPLDKELPDIPLLKDEQEMKGYIKYINEYQFILGNNILQKNPIVLQKIDLNEMSRLSQKQVFPFVLRLDPKEANGFLREWVINVSPPKKHLGYAVQWFCMAFVLCIAFLCFSFERVELNESQYAN